MDIQKSFVSIPSGEKIAYISGGSGDKTILAIHGNTASSVFMKSFIDNAPEGYRVIAPDLCGFGDSTYNTPVLSMEKYAHQLYEFSCALGVSKAVVVGWSLGGGAAMELAALYPDFVTHLVLISSTPCAGFPLFKKNADGSFAAYATLEEMSGDPAVMYNRAALAAKNTEYFKNAYNMVIYTVNKPSDEEYDLQMSEAVKEVCILEADWALAVFNMTDFPNLYGAGSGRINKIVCPVLMTSGDKDLIVPDTLVNMNLAAFGGRAKHIRYENAGHAQFIDVPEKFFGDFCEFISH